MLSIFSNEPYKSFMCRYEDGCECIKLHFPTDCIEELETNVFPFDDVYMQNLDIILSYSEFRDGNKKTYKIEEKISFLFDMDFYDVIEQALSNIDKIKNSVYVSPKVDYFNVNCFIKPGGKAVLEYTIMYPSVDDKLELSLLLLSNTVVLFSRGW